MAFKVQTVHKVFKVCWVLTASRVFKVSKVSRAFKVCKV